MWGEAGRSLQGGAEGERKEERVGLNGWERSQDLDAYAGEGKSSRSPWPISILPRGPWCKETESPPFIPKPSSAIKQKSRGRREKMSP